MRSYEHLSDGSIVYLDTLGEEEKARARRTIVAGLRQGLDAYQLSVGDKFEVLFHFDRKPASDDYTIMVGDEVSIEFLEDPDNSRSLRIPPDGWIFLPLIKPVRATGLTADELAQRITGRYEGVLTSAVVTVNVRDFSTPLDDFGEVLGGREAGRSREIVVSPGGAISLPFLPPIWARGRTIEDLREELDVAYAALGMNITVTLLPTTIRGNRILIFGEVVEPGPLLTDDRPHTVLTAVASAGGVLASGSMESVKVFYVSDDMQPRVRSVNLVNVLENLQLEQDMILPDNSVIYIPPTRLAKVGRFLDAVLHDILRYNGINSSFGISYILNQEDGTISERVTTITP